MSERKKVYEVLKRTHGGYSGYMEIISFPTKEEVVEFIASKIKEEQYYPEIGLDNFRLFLRDCKGELGEGHGSFFHSVENDFTITLTDTPRKNYVDKRQKRKIERRKARDSIET